MACSEASPAASCVIWAGLVSADGAGDCNIPALAGAGRPRLGGGWQKRWSCWGGESFPCWGCAAGLKCGHVPAVPVCNGVVVGQCVCSWYAGGPPELIDLGGYNHLTVLCSVLTWARCGAPAPKGALRCCTEWGGELEWV